MKILCVPTTHPTHHSHFSDFIPTLTLGNFQFTTQESHRYTLKKERKKKRKIPTKTVTFQPSLKQDLTWVEELYLKKRSLSQSSTSQATATSLTAASIELACFWFTAREYHSQYLLTRLILLTTAQRTQEFCPRNHRLRAFECALYLELEFFAADNRTR